MTMATNEFPSPANARPVQMPEPKAVLAANSAPTTLADAFQRFAGQESFVLDPDLRPAIEDMASAAEGSRWKEQWPQWLNQLVNDALRNYLGR